MASGKSDITNEMLVHVVLDRSGSMSDIRHETITGLNHYINKLREDQETKYWLSLTQFDHNMGPELTVTYDDTPLDKVTDLIAAQYEPRGGTPLLDAIGECIKRTEAKGRGITMVINTDGHENQSKEYTRAAVKQLIKDKTAEGWTFVFLGAEIDSYGEGGSIGTFVGNTSNYQKTAGSIHNLYAASANSTMKRAASNRTVGTLRSSSMAFFSNEQKVAMDATFDPASAGSISSAQQPITMNAPQGVESWLVNATGELVDPLGGQFPDNGVDNQQVGAVNNDSQQ